MGNLQKTKGTVMTFVHHYRNNDMENKTLINDGSEEVNTRPMFFTGIPLLAVSVDDFSSLL